MGAKISDLGLIMSFPPYLRSAMAQFPLVGATRQWQSHCYCLDKPVKPLFQTSLPLTRMVWAMNVHSLLWTFWRLRNTSKQASMNIYSEIYGDLAVTVRKTFAGQADQAPRRGGRQSSTICRLRPLDAVLSSGLC